MLTGICYLEPDQMMIEGEYVRGELPMLKRESLKVVVANFEVHAA